MFSGKTKWILLLALILWAGGGVLYYLNQNAAPPAIEPPPVTVPGKDGGDFVKPPGKAPLKPLSQQKPDTASQDKKTNRKPLVQEPKGDSRLADKITVTRSAELADLEYRVKEVLRANMVPESRLNFLFSGQLGPLSCSKADDPGDWPVFYRCKRTYDIHVVNENKTNVIELPPGNAQNGAADMEVAGDYTMDDLVEKLARIVGFKIYPAKERDNKLSMSFPDKSIQEWWQETDRLSEMADALIDERRNKP